MLNKKTIFLILLISVLVLPCLANAQERLQKLAKSIETAVVDVAISVVVIGWVIAGILYLTATGNPERMGTARKALIACIIGTVLVVLAMTSGAVVSIAKSVLGL